MRKTYRMLFALVLMALFAMDASATLKRVPLTADMFFEWDGWGADAQKKSETPAACIYELGKPAGDAFGDSQVNNYADLSGYVTLEITFSEGTPRVLLNRDTDGGQWDADEANSHLIDNTKGGWSARYFTTEGNVMKVDLKQLVADKGFAHLHAIKGANWGKVTLEKLALISDNGRVELEADMFHAWTTDGADAEIIDEPEDWWSDGAKFSCDLNYFRNLDAGDVCYGNGNVVWQWYADLTGVKKMHFYGDKGLTMRVIYNRKPYEEGMSDGHGGDYKQELVTIGDDGTAVLDIEALNLEYFHLNCLKVQWGTHGYFKSVEIEGGDIKGSGKIYDPMEGITASFQADVVSINLGKNTNLNELLNGQDRILFPVENGQLTVNGKDINLLSVEGFFDENNNARVFLFMDDMSDAIDESENETAVVKASFINPTDATMQLKFASGRFEGTVIDNIKDLQATFEDGLGEYYSNTAKLPVLVAAEPELGSINLPVDKTEFKVTFSGNVNAAEMKATFDGAAMTIAPAEGFATEFTLTRAAGDVKPGVHEIVLSNIKAEQDFLEEVGEETIKYSFGAVDSDESVETYMTDGFADEGNGDGSCPAAWLIDHEGTDRTELSGQWGGCRVIVGAAGNNGFTPAIAYICPRNNFSDGHAIYGAKDGYHLTLEPKTYHLTLGAAAWDCENPYIKVEVAKLISVSSEPTPKTKTLVVNNQETEVTASSYDIEDEVIADTLALVSASYKNSKDALRIDLPFTVETAGDYILKFIPCNANGEAGGYGTALAIGDIKVQYIPNVMGIEMKQALKQALADAENVRDANTDARYAGEAFTTLDNLIKASDPNVLQTPTEFEKAAADLKAAADAMNAHHKLCADFDALPAQLYAKIEQFADSKFAADPIYTDMQTAFNKYATVVDEEQEVEGVPQVVKVVKPNLITDDTELQAGIDEMNAVLAKAGMFTEGASQNNTTGYAALHERLRLGVATAVALGIEESDAAVVAANAELGDNDDVANALKAAITKKLYANLNTNPTVEEPIDMTVFIKNPNIYVTKASKKDLDAAPGWTINNIGGGNLGDIWYTAGGGTHLATDVVPADEAITSTGNITFTQEITDLPAGVYQVTAYMGERRGDSDFKGLIKDDDEEFVEKLAALPGDATDEDKDALRLSIARERIFPQEFVFVNTTATAEGQYDNQTPVTTNGKSWGATDNNRIISENITITDGQATIGVKSSGQNTWFAFNEIHLSLVAAAEGFDYSKLPTAIETLEGTPAVKVSAIEMFDINGRRVAKAQKGLVIMKQIMSDGSIRTQKVVK